MTRRILGRSEVLSVVLVRISRWVLQDCVLPDGPATHGAATSWRVYLPAGRGGLCGKAGELTCVFVEKKMGHYF
jgi:hypothetical protein